ncbi:MAG: serine/threonine-protein kinase [Thiobacillus sp.]
MLSQKNIGRYEVVATLGQGAMGTVYKAVDPLIERTVAIKTINLNLSNEERAEFEERFYREAKSAGRLSHANIVTIYDVGETDNIAYIAMEYLEGESLRDMLDSGVVLPVEMIGKIAARIASALNYAHENQVVHRDIKPANIMIMPNRDVKIMDFGIAQIPTGSRTQLGTVLGSPKYMAPEQVAGKATDGKTDIFALGVVLYEMLTGTTPFNGDNLSAIMYKLLNEEPMPPSTLNPRVPPVFDRIISRALSKRPEDRYQTAREFARDLRNRDAVFPQAPQKPSASSQPPPTGKTSRAPAGQQDATLVLSPDQARGVVTASTRPRAPVKRDSTAAMPGGAQPTRKLWLFALPVLAIALWMIYSQPRLGSRVPTPTLPVLEAAAVSSPQTMLEPVADIAPAAASQPTVASVPTAPIASARQKIKPRDSSTQVKAPPTAPATKVQESAALSFAVSPWGEVLVDGKSVGVSPPLTALQLDAGSHKVEIRNQAFTPYRETVKLKPGQSLKLRHKFD